MFTNKTVVLSGDNKEFNITFMERFYDKVKEIKILTDNIFDKTFDDLEKVALYSNEESLQQCLNGADYLYHFIDEELSQYNNFFSLKDDKKAMVSNLIKAAINSHTKRVLFLSDGTTSLANDKMIKNLVVKGATTILQTQNTVTSINYVVAKGYENLHELLDFAIFATKTGSNGDVFVKKAEEKVSFASRLKQMIAPKTKIEAQRESFFTSAEMSRALDYGKYFKIALDSENIPYQKFEDRLNSLKIDIKELEEV